MLRTDKQAWLRQGLVLLAAHGAPAVTLDRLCESMRMSKGSFYHHFGSMPKYRTQLFGYFETEYTTAIIDRVEAFAWLPPSEKFRRLLAEATKDDEPPGEVAMRAWAKQDPEAATVMERVDARRMSYLQALSEQAGHDEPVRTATLIYLVLVGAEHLMPPLPMGEVRDMYEFLLPLLDQPASRFSGTEERT